MELFQEKIGAETTTTTATTTATVEITEEVTSTEVTPTEVTPTEVTPSEVTPTEVTPTEVTLTEVTPTEVTPTEGSTSEGSTSEGSTSEGSTSEGSTSEVTSTEVTSTEVTSTEVTASEGSTSEDSTAESTSVESTSAESTTTEGLPKFDGDAKALEAFTYEDLVDLLNATEFTMNMVDPLYPTQEQVDATQNRSVEWSEANDYLDIDDNLALFVADVESEGIPLEQIFADVEDVKVSVDESLEEVSYEASTFGVTIDSPFMITVIVIGSIGVIMLAVGFIMVVKYKR